MDFMAFDPLITNKNLSIVTLKSELIQLINMEKNNRTEVKKIVKKSDFLFKIGKLCNHFDKYNGMKSTKAFAFTRFATTFLDDLTLFTSSRKFSDL